MKTEKSTMLNIFNNEQMNTWSRLNECQHLEIQSFLICEILIKLRMISIVLLHSYKESNQKTAFLDGGGISDLFYLYSKMWMSTKYYLLDAIHVPKILLSH